MTANAKSAVLLFLGQGLPLLSPGNQRGIAMAHNSLTSIAVAQDSMALIRDMSIDHQFQMQAGGLRGT